MSYLHYLCLDLLSLYQVLFNPAQNQEIVFQFLMWNICQVLLPKSTNENYYLTHHGPYLLHMLKYKLNK